jgi:hypothetical protein
LRSKRITSRGLYQEECDAREEWRDRVLTGNFLGRVGVLKVLVTQDIRAHQSTVLGISDVPNEIIVESRKENVVRRTRRRGECQSMSVVEIDPGQEDWENECLLHVPPPLLQTSLLNVLKSPENGNNLDELSRRDMNHGRQLGSGSGVRRRGKVVNVIRLCLIGRSTISWIWI